MIFALLWLALTGGSSSSLYYGAAATAAATLVSLRLFPADRARLQLWRAMFFAPLLLARGILGGLDVARRVFDPRLPVAPDWVRLELANRHDEANTLLGGVISILPGTLSAGPRDGVMEVHVLDASKVDMTALKAEERRVLRLFGRRITKEEGADG